MSLDWNWVDKKWKASSIIGIKEHWQYENEAKMSSAKIKLVA